MARHTAGAQQTYDKRLNKENNMKVQEFTIHTKHEMYSQTPYFGN